MCSVGGLISVPTLRSKLEIAKKIEPRTAPKLERQLRRAQEQLLRRRRDVDAIAATPMRPLGAFVTFECAPRPRPPVHPCTIRRPSNIPLRREPLLLA